METHSRRLGDATIHVLDGLFDDAVRAAIFHRLAGLHYFRKQGDFEGDRYLTLAATLDPGALRDDPGFAFHTAIARAVSRCVPLERYALWSVHVNQIHYGDASFPHTDCPAGTGDLTVLYYAHREWDAAWGGHTLIVEPGGPFEVAIAPVPGRVLVFPGDLLHCGGVPGRTCTVSRYTLTLKYALREQGGRDAG
ncbi:MAG: 2OG-Fe(II) oxygenase [Planctomycetes bacterium]|nr:2OG-Fe(II) oxygenase [Planctomycetota bacterium]